MPIHHQLEQGRRAKKWTQADLAAQTGLTRMTVQRIEAGSSDPRMSTLKALASVLNLDVMLVPSALRPELEAFIQRLEAGAHPSSSAPLHAST